MNETPKPNKPRTLITTPDTTGTIPSSADLALTPLSVAISHLKLTVVLEGADITHGTRQYVPIITLLARTLNTRRQDVVLCAWPLLGCPYLEFEPCLRDIGMYVVQGTTRAKIDLKQMLDTRLAREQRMTYLMDIVDMLQALAEWDLGAIARWVGAVERRVFKERPGVMVKLQAMADEARARHDREGLLSPEVLLAPGVVVPVEGIDGKGRVN